MNYAKLPFKLQTVSVIARPVMRRPSIRVRFVRQENHNTFIAAFGHSQGKPMERGLHPIHIGIFVVDVSVQLEDIFGEMH